MGGTLALLGAGLSLPVSFAPPEVEYLPCSVVFDGTNDYLTRSSELTGMVDGKRGSISFWARPDVRGSNINILCNASNRVQIYRDNNDAFRFVFKNSANTIILRFRTAQLQFPPFGGEGTWYHVAASWDMDVASGGATLFIDGVDALDTVENFTLGETIDYATGSWHVGSLDTNLQLWDGGLSEIWFDSTDNLDFSDSDVLALFRNSDGFPEDLGANGELPTGSSPILYLRGCGADFVTNYGTGGDFTLTGTLDEGNLVYDDTSYLANAVDFSEAGSYLSKAADLSGNADGQKGILSFWVKRPINGDEQVIAANDSGFLRAFFDTSGQFNFQLKKADGTTISAGFKDAIDGGIDANWHNYLLAWDLANDVANSSSAGIALAVDGKWRPLNHHGYFATTWENGETADYTRTSWAVAADTDGTDELDGDMAELYLNLGEWLDLSDPYNTLRFINSNGEPNNLGSDGSRPTGTAPIIYLPNLASVVEVNEGSGGDFTRNGTINNATTSPSSGWEPPYHASAVVFDGINDNLLRGADYTGIVDGKKMSLSFWFRLVGSSSQYILDSDGSRFFVVWDGLTKKVRVETKNTVGSTNLRVDTVSEILDNDWHHLAFSCDLSRGGAELYLDDVLDRTTSILNNSNIDYTRPNHAVGSLVTGGSKLNAEMADLYFDPIGSSDMGNLTTRRKFIDEAGKPVFLGANGELPTGSSPILFLSGDATDFATNKGTGGGMTTTGALTDASTSPSD